MQHNKTGEDMRTIDLFCGCGGMSLGFQNAGFNIVAAFDNWEAALNVYKKNFSHPVFCCDISNKEIHNQIAKMNADIIIGGPPCQDFSTAGLMDEEIGRAQLTVVYSQIIAKAKPRFFVMENVARANKSKAYASAMKIFRENGYGLTTMLLDASFCGVPQVRKRYFVIGELNGEDGFLNDYLARDLSSKPMTIFDYLGDSLGTEYYFRVPTNYSRRGVYSIYEPAVTVRGVDRPIPKGYKKHPQDPVEIGPLVRALTVKERSYLQTFPEEFVLDGSKTDLNQMIGNAVPVNLAKYVALALLNYIADKKQGELNEQ